MEETIEHLFRYVEEKIIGLEMLLKHGKGYSKSYDQQLFKPVDFFVIDYEIYKHDAESVKKHTGYLLNKYHALFNNEIKLTRLASLDEDGLEFSTISVVSCKLKEELKKIINKLIEYKELISSRESTSFEKTENLKLRVSFVDYIISLEINDIPIFITDTEEDCQQLKNSLIQFISKNIEAINPVINLNTPHKKEKFAYYIVSRVAEASGLAYVSIKNITINSEPYSEESGSRHRSKYRKSIEENNAAPDFEEFYYSFEEAIKTHLA